jgi:alpha-tubulin suppressor-like RCC1 family protein
MPTFYNFRENGLDYSFDDIFVPADLFREGNLWDWGFEDAGRLGNAITSSASISTPVTTFSGGTNWKQVHAGRVNTAAIKTDGTLWIWGAGGNGKLGNAVTTGDISTPVTTFSGGTNWKQVHSGWYHTAAIKTDGTLWTWGYGLLGILGNGITVGNISTPVTTFAGGSNWKQVSNGQYFTAAIKTDGTLWTWGIGNLGQLGNGQISAFPSTPVTTFAGGTNWKQVSCGGYHVAAVKTDGTLWTWGAGSNGRLGNGATVGSISTPVTTFSGGTNWKQSACGRFHTTAIKTDGTLWTWGAGSGGKLGNATTTGDISTPVTTFSGGTNWKQVSGASDNTAAIKTDGTLWTWGSGTQGKLGNGVATFAYISTPITTFAGGSNWKQVSGGDLHIAALTYIDSVI